MGPVSNGQIAAIHTLKSRAALDEDSYRDLLDQIAGVRSSKALSHGQAGVVIDRLKALAKPSQGPLVAPSKAPGALALHGPYAGICRALWISAWHLGLVEHREDTALVAFVRRQTGLDHLNWLREPAEARKVIEALKGWMSRDAGVRWPARSDDQGAARKLAVVAAQMRLLGEPDAVPPGDVDAIISSLGDRVRRLKRETKTA